MVFEWNGMFVHTSEWEPKQPQLDLTYFTDAQTLQNARPQANISAISKNWWRITRLSNRWCS
jgi:hypothetical protein